MAYRLEYLLANLTQAGFLRFMGLFNRQKRKGVNPADEILYKLVFSFNSYRVSDSMLRDDCD